jgi:hypothetical protein
MMPNHPQPHDRSMRILRIALLVFGGQIVILYVLHFLFLSGTSVFEVFNDGWDYRYFYWGAQAWLAGHDPLSFCA